MEWLAEGQPRLILDQDAEGRWHVVAYYEPTVSEVERQAVLDTVQAALDRSAEIRQAVRRVAFIPPLRILPAEEC